MKKNTLSKSYRVYLAQEMKDPQFVKEYEKLENETGSVEVRELPLKDIRFDAGMTQMELAAKTGWSQADISKLENGKREISLKTLQKIADSLDMNLEIRLSRR